MNFNHYHSICFVFLFAGWIPQSFGDYTNCSKFNCSSTIAQPSVVFGINNKGIELSKQMLQENANLIQNIIEEELNTDNAASRAGLGTIINEVVNKPFPVVNDIDFIEGGGIQANGLDFIFNPEEFSVNPKVKSVTGMNFLPRTKYRDALREARDLCLADYPRRGIDCSHLNSRGIPGGVDISNFSLYDIDVKYDLAGSTPSVKICGKFKLDVGTDLGLDIDGQENVITVKNINFRLNNRVEHCFRANVDVANMQLSKVTRIGNRDIVSRSAINSALANPRLEYEFPETSLVYAGTNGEVNKDLVARALAPILAEDKIQSAIETPVVGLISELVETKVNLLMEHVLQNKVDTPLKSIEVPGKDLGSPMVSSGLANAVDIINEKNCRSRSGKVKDALKSIEWLVANNPSFRDGSALTGITCLSRLSRSQRNLVNNAISTLGRRSLTPMNETTNTIITGLNLLPIDGPSLSAFVPELCVEQNMMNSRNASSRLATSNFINNCGGAFSLVSLEFINKTLARPELHKAMCIGTSSYSNNNGETAGCEFKVISEKQSYAEDKVMFRCGNIAPVKIKTINPSSPRADNKSINIKLAINMEGCFTKGSLGLGSIEDAEVIIDLTATVGSDNCPPGVQLCTNINPSTAAFEENTENPTWRWVAAKVRKKLRESVDEYIPKIQDQINEALGGKALEDFSVNSMFQVPTTSGDPGAIGMCLRPSNSNDVTKKYICKVAKSRYPSNRVIQQECADFI